MAKIQLNRRLIAVIHDLIMAAVSFVLALYLRLGDATFAFTSEFIVEATVLFTLVCGVVFWRVGFHRSLWRYASLDDLLALIKGVTLALLIFLPLLFLATRLELYPRSAVVINWFVLIALLGGPRFIYRMVKDRGIGLALKPASLQRIPVLLVGAGDAAELFIREMARSAATADYEVVGIVDDRRELAGVRIRGVAVLGTLDELDAVVDELGRRGRKPQRLILAERTDGETVRRLLDAADGLGMTLARLPRLTNFESGDDKPFTVRPIAVEDLLGRPQTVLDREAMRALIAGKRILVTGAGGTIGAELVRQAAALGPAHITLFDNAEFNLYTIDGALTAQWPEAPRSAMLGDVRDRTRIDAVFARERPELVFHAAAFKHVPMVEANPNEGVLTNVVGTRHVADACRAAAVEAMVLISTDKAVEPTSVMGATKRIAELYCQALGATLGPGGTRFITVRFGNVLGSTGSVVPLFQRQLANGGPLTVTHPDMTRFFMTVREAVELVLQASAIGGGAAAQGGEIFVLEMGRPVRIVDLARQMIRLAGLRPDEDVEIAFSGVRPGEKLHESLFYATEQRLETGHDGVLLATSPPADLAMLQRQLSELTDAAEARRTTETLALIHRLVADYGPVETGQRATARA